MAAGTRPSVLNIACIGQKGTWTMPRDDRQGEMPRRNKIGLAIVLISVIALLLAAWQLYQLVLPA